MKIRILAMLAALFLATIVSPVFAQDIDTRAQAMNGFSSFGYPGSQNLGQIFVVPVGVSSVKSFSFVMESLPATANFRGVLMAWDTTNNRPIGPVLYQSADVSTTDSTRQEIIFTIPGEAEVAAGQTYVVFGTTANSVGSGQGLWAWAPDVYPGGHLVFLNATTSADWITSSWSRNSSGDLGFTVQFGAAAPAPVPTMTEWAMILLGVMLAGSAAVILQRRRMAA